MMTSMTDRSSPPPSPLGTLDAWLVAAAESGNVLEVAKASKAGANVNVHYSASGAYDLMPTGPTGSGPARSVMAAAVERGDLPVIKALILLGATTTGDDMEYDRDVAFTLEQTRELRADVVAWAVSATEQSSTFRATVLFGCSTCGTNPDPHHPAPIAKLGGQRGILMAIAEVRTRSRVYASRVLYQRCYCQV
jgi:hypothetical protein